jgi:hypothetical protein
VLRAGFAAARLKQFSDEQEWTKPKTTKAIEAATFDALR